MDGGGAAPGGVGGGALLSEGRFAGGGGQGDGPAGAGGVLQQAGEPGGEVAGGVRFRAEFDDARGEADQVDGMDEVGVQAGLATLGDQGGDIAEAGQARSDCGFGHLGGGAVGHGTSAAAGAGGGGRGARFGGFGQAADEVAGGRQVGRVAEADQDHLGGGAAVRGGFDFGDAFEEHLPGAAEDGDGEAFGQGDATGAFGFGQVVGGAQGGHGAQAGQGVDEVEHVLEHDAEIGAAGVGAVGDVECGCGFAGHGGFEQGEDGFAVGEAEHVGDHRAGDLLAGFDLGDCLVQQRQAVAGGAVGGAGDELQRALFHLGAFTRADLGE